MGTRTITPRELDELGRERAVELIDVRTPREFRDCHVDYARLIPLDTLDPRAIMTRRSGVTNDPIYLICHSGTRARQACARFHECGYGNVAVVEGGTAAWEGAGLPVVRGKKAISLERQVRIAAGTLVLLGSLLGAFVHPVYIGLAAFVGAGLIFAGITDTCGMAMVLARLPWNQVRPDDASCELAAQSDSAANLRGGTKS
jgi:rhodanese-related sulfurtransferase